MDNTGRSRENRQKSGKNAGKGAIKTGGKGVGKTNHGI
jgi:hypothetical protein